MSEVEIEAGGRPSDAEDPRSSMAYRVAELKKALGEHQTALIELRTRLELERDAATLRVALAEAQGAVQAARLRLQIEKAQTALQVERATRERLEADLDTERDRYESLALAITGVPWWAPWRRRRIVEGLHLMTDPA